MLLAQAERRLGIAERLAQIIPDWRDRERVTHLLPDIAIFFSNSKRRIHFLPNGFSGFAGPRMCACPLNGEHSSGKHQIATSTSAGKAGIVVENFPGNT